MRTEDARQQEKAVEEPRKVTNVFEVQTVEPPVGYRGPIPQKDPIVRAIERKEPFYSMLDGFTVADTGSGRQIVSIDGNWLSRLLTSDGRRRNRRAKALSAQYANALGNR